MSHGIASYFSTQGHTIDYDTKAIIENGLLVVISKRDESISWSLQKTVIKRVVKASKCISSGVKAVGSWFYSIGSSVCNYFAPVIDACVDTFDYITECGIAAGQAIKEKVAAAMDAIVETEIVKMATQTVKDVANDVGEKVASATEAIGDTVITVADKTDVIAASKAVAAGNYAGNVAVTVGTTIADAVTATDEYITDTKIFKVAKQTFDTAMNVAKNLYQKMNACVTATYESYLYYNRYRVNARRLAIEQRITDEHFILQNFDKALSYENRTQVNDN